MFNEVQWYGAHEKDVDGNDEFIELRNLTDRVLELDMWQITNASDVVVGLPPGSVVPAGGVFSIVDHVTEFYEDGAPQDENTAFTTGDMVVNAFNDNRQSRLYLKDQRFELFLKDPDGNLMDEAGDGGPAFTGGPEGTVVRSMQRANPPGDGASPARWSANSVTEGGVNVNPDPINLGDSGCAVPGEASCRTYREIIMATPGEP